MERMRSSIGAHRLCRLVLAVVVALWSVPGLAWAVELEVLGDMTSPHGGFGTYQNLLQWSESFNTSPPWVPSGVSLTPDSATLLAPDGSATADTLAFSGVGTVDSLTQNSQVAATAEPYTFSLWMRTNAGTAAMTLRIEDHSVTPQGASNDVTVTASWERYAVSYTFAGSPTGTMNVKVSETSDTNPTVLIWGAQLEKSAKANVYVRTDDSPVSSVEQGLAVGKNVHITGDLEIHGNIIQHGAEGGGPGNMKTKGNILWDSGTTHTMTFDHAITMDRTVTFPDASTTMVGTDVTQTLTNKTIDPASNSLTLTSGNILVGNGSNVAAGVAMSGDVTIDNAGAVTIGAGKVTSAKILDGTIVDADVSATSAIAGTKIAPDFGAQNVVTTGNVGIGTVSPGAKLDVRGTSGDIFILRRSSDGLAIVTYSGTNLLTMQDIDVVGTARLRGTVYGSGNPAFDILSSGNVNFLGNVGIGTTTPGAKLSLATATTAAGGIDFGGDTNLYRSSADTLKTDGAFVIASTLGVTGAATLGSSLVVAGNVAVNTDKLTVNAATGNTAVAGTLTSGATSVAGNLSVRSNDKLVMDSADAAGAANDTYLVHDDAHQRVRLYVDGIEVARFKK